jgi:hypothetical protein
MPEQVRKGLPPDACTRKVEGAARVFRSRLPAFKPLPKCGQHRNRTITLEEHKRAFQRFHDVAGRMCLVQLDPVPDFDVGPPACLRQVERAGSQDNGRSAAGVEYFDYSQFGMLAGAGNANRNIVDFKPGSELRIEYIEVVSDRELVSVQAHEHLQLVVAQRVVGRQCCLLQQQGHHLKFKKIGLEAVGGEERPRNRSFANGLPEAFADGQ